MGINILLGILRYIPLRVSLISRRRSSLVVTWRGSRRIGNSGGWSTGFCGSIFLWSSFNAPKNWIDTLIKNINKKAYQKWKIRRTIKNMACQRNTRERFFGNMYLFQNVHSCKSSGRINFCENTFFSLHKKVFYHDNHLFCSTLMRLTKFVISKFRPVVQQFS